MSKTEVLHGDCLELLRDIPSETVDLVYLDPPFFTGKIQKLRSREDRKEFSFKDIWNGYEEYAEFIYNRVVEVKRILKDSGSVFFHCDKNATHIIRAILNDIFGESNFRSEIIWSYRRWSNKKKGLLPAHQTIYYYSKTKNYKFNFIYNGYSETTNIDQILQKRIRTKDGKVVYAKDNNGNIILDDEKKGVPLSDVWEIPYLNPKAKERVGYPTQKPILLLERIIKLVTDRGDLVVDPFCGSGTTLVAAKILGRHSIGIDISKDAVELSLKRLNNLIRSDSNLLKKGRDAYSTADLNALSLLQGLEFIPVHRNKGIDAILKQQYKNTPILIRIQKKGESILDAAFLLANAAKKKKALKSFLIVTSDSFLLSEDILKMLPDSIELIDSPALLIKRIISNDNSRHVYQLTKRST
jgi:site-specific DNA-methyltransferase (adenine-specific)